MSGEIITSQGSNGVSKSPLDSSEVLDHFIIRFLESIGMIHLSQSKYGQAICSWGYLAG